ncbi:MAG: virulence RhuM family protein [Culturomica sp.]|jgi:hypothetical protein|nr:virulence RhuM family protein [Culturomica sp.]
MPETNGKIILYQPDSMLQLEVRVENDTVWLNRQQIAVLFDRDVKTIGKHINNALSEELAEIAEPTNFSNNGNKTENVVVAKFATTTKHGAIAGKTQTKQVEYYSLDVIISVGYRVKSNQGIKFRLWANRVLKTYLLQGYAINQRFMNLENRVYETEKKIDFFVKTALPPAEGIFFDGQIFDAYKFVSDLIKSAQKSIVLIDNYIDESVLILLAKRDKNVEATIYTKEISKVLQLDIEKHNAQYSPITVTVFTKSHDRFLIIDNTVYHIGASLKDLGKKWFAFSKMLLNADEHFKEFGINKQG